MNEESRERTQDVTHQDVALERTTEGEAAPATRSEPGAAADQGRSTDEIREALISVVKTIYDPEIPVDIYELGLIYKLEVDSQGAVSIDMTLTTPMCPVAEILPPEVEAKARAVEGVTKVDLQLVWDPPWSVDRMSEAARLELNR